MNPFARSPQGLLLDAIARRYGVRPSSLLGLSAGSGEAYLLDEAIYLAAAEREAEAQTLAGELRAKRRSWPKEIVEELKSYVS